MDIAETLIIWRCLCRMHKIVVSNRSYLSLVSLIFLLMVFSHLYDRSVFWWQCLHLNEDHLKYHQPWSKRVLFFLLLLWLTLTLSERFMHICIVQRCIWNLFLALTQTVNNPCPNVRRKSIFFVLPISLSGIDIYDSIFTPQMVILSLHPDYFWIHFVASTY